MADHFDISPHADAKFVAAWSKMESAGYIYSESNVAKVHLGWLMAQREPTEVTGTYRFEIHETAEPGVLQLHVFTEDGCTDIFEGSYVFIINQLTSYYDDKRRLRKVR